MIDLIFVSLFLAATGDPTPPPATEASTPAVQQTQNHGPEGQPDSTGQTDARHQMHCHNEHVTGSRLPTRVCLSQAQEDAAREESRQLVQRAQSGQEATPGN